MLRTLSVRNVILIKRLDIGFESGLCVLTGETGSGKSILLDALGLAMGIRADSNLIKLGENQSVVTAAFELDNRVGLSGLLRQQGIEFDKSLILRRVLNSDGRSRAFVNDQPVSVSFLRRVGEMLVEIHGQKELYGLLDPANHCWFVDAFGKLEGRRGKVRSIFRSWKDAQTKLDQANKDLEIARRDEGYLRHAVTELVRLDPQPGEEEVLAGQRTVMMHTEKLVRALTEAFEDIHKGEGVGGSLRSALQKLERVADKADGQLDVAICALDRSLVEANEAIAELELLAEKLDEAPTQLEQVEERLFALRALARKHGTDVAGLLALREELERKLADLQDWSSHLDILNADVGRLRHQYIQDASELTKAREKSAKAIDKAIEAELPPLKLETAIFKTIIEDLPECEWGENGRERVTFEVKTNPNTPHGPLHKIASTGELSRLMLALKVALADANSVPTIIFDEVDAGIGGAVAAAVGNRLARLSEGFQVLVITHSPQVAARGDKHWRITKTHNGNSNLTLVDTLGPDDRTEEIARMLAGSQVTEAARAAANQLLNCSAVDEALA